MRSVIAADRNRMIVSSGNEEQFDDFPERLTRLDGRDF